MPQNVIGVDIAKDWIDTHCLDSGKKSRIEMSPRALKAFVRRCRSALVVFEASGGYERPLVEALRAAEIAYARVNPRQAREFARATGRLAKTDRVDAEVLVRMGRALELAPAPPPDPARERLAALMARRDDLTGEAAREACRLKQAHAGSSGSGKRYRSALRAARGLSGCSACGRGARGGGRMMSAASTWM